MTFIVLVGKHTVKTSLRYFGLTVKHPQSAGGSTHPKSAAAYNGHKY